MNGGCEALQVRIPLLILTKRRNVFLVRFYRAKPVPEPQGRVYLNIELREGKPDWRCTQHRKDDKPLQSCNWADASAVNSSVCSFVCEVLCCDGILSEVQVWDVSLIVNDYVETSNLILLQKCITSLQIWRQVLWLDATFKLQLFGFCC